MLFRWRTYWQCSNNMPLLRAARSRRLPKMYRHRFSSQEADIVSDLFNRDEI